eukprot:TRINITY_DN13402_c0_g2_i6.p1 TRINITY_DN13402_c0_g2~~TRINITY_DN13402_c0_g2_i6.p1  ORF type:complete len:303 (+),score=124.57 TRINITY_DN13402_c0_g2_i6:689-1597(+)
MEGSRVSLITASDQCRYEGILTKIDKQTQQIIVDLVQVMGTEGREEAMGLNRIEKSTAIQSELMSFSAGDIADIRVLQPVGGSTTTTATPSGGNQEYESSSEEEESDEDDISSDEEGYEDEDEEDEVQEQAANSMMINQGNTVSGVRTGNGMGMGSGNGNGMPLVQGGGQQQQQQQQVMQQQAIKRQAQQIVAAQMGQVKKQMKAREAEILKAAQEKIQTAHKKMVKIIEGKDKEIQELKGQVTSVQTQLRYSLGVDLHEMDNQQLVQLREMVGVALSNLDTEVDRRMGVQGSKYNYTRAKQ